MSRSVGSGEGAVTFTPAYCSGSSVEARADHHDGGEPQRLALLQVVEVDLGVGDRRQVVLAQRVHVVGGERLADEVVQDVVAADRAVDHRAGRLALPETGDLHLAGDVAIGAIEVALEFLGGNLDLQPDGVPPGLLHCRLHAESRVLEIGAATCPIDP